MKYSFVVKGTYQDGTKATFKGEVEDADHFPWSAFDQAIRCAKAMSPGLTVDINKPGHCTLRKLKKR